MTVAFFDCFSGICGDMILGALFDLGLDVTYFKNEIKKLAISGYNIEVNDIEKNHIKAKDVKIAVIEKQPHRSYQEIKEMIQESGLDEEIKKLSQKIFLKLAKVEGKIHNIDYEQVHFHEVGAIDSIIDIVGSVIGIKKLGIDHIYCSPLPLGTGFIKCSHGVIPIPAPATIELLKNVPVYQTDRMQELVTPTGAAVISTIADRFQSMPPMHIERIGYGCGKTEGSIPPLLRIIIGELAEW